MSDTSASTTPDDYDREDGYDSKQGVEQCPHCEAVFSPNGGYFGTVFDQEGRAYETLYASEPDDGPFFCAGCWLELETNRKQQTHHALSEFE